MTRGRNVAVAHPVLRDLLVTRPADEAMAWAAQLRAAGWPARALPLIDIAAPADPAVRSALARMREQAPSFDALMFVSGAAVAGFFDGLPATAWPATARFWAPGPATARRLAEALAAHGVDAGRVDAPPGDAAQFDSEALWPVVRAQIGAGSRVLLVRGGGTADTASGSGREWLLRQCREAGAQVSVCMAYERRAPEWTPERIDLARRGAVPGALWLFSSSEALDNLAGLPAELHWHQASAIATHPRIAERARAMGFGQVSQTRPTLPEVLAALESSWSHP